LVAGRRLPVAGRRSPVTRIKDNHMCGYERLEVYQRSFALLKPVHQIVMSFPDYEKFDLASQIRRAAKSVPANIAEGYAHKTSPKEFGRYLTIALGSANEVKLHFKVAAELEHAGPDKCAYFIDEYGIVGKQVYRLIEYWRRKPARRPATGDQEPGGHD
jgi:four helix bundle protein